MRLFLLILPVLLLSGCMSFGQSTKEYAATVTPMMTSQLANSNVGLLWLKSILQNHQTRVRREIVAEAASRGVKLDPSTIVVEIDMENPKYDPTVIDETGQPVEPAFVAVDIQIIIDSLETLIKMNFEMARAMDTLNESIQEDRGLDPLFQQVKDALSDEQVAELIRLYGKKLLEEAGKKPVR